MDIINYILYIYSIKKYFRFRVGILIKNFHNKDGNFFITYCIKYTNFTHKSYSPLEKNYDVTRHYGVSIRYGELDIVFIRV